MPASRSRQIIIYVSPVALDFEQLRVAQGDVLSGQGVGGAQEVLAIEILLGLDRRLVDAEQAGGGDAQEPSRVLR